MSVYNDRTRATAAAAGGERGLPTKYFSITAEVALARSICDIWPIFSASVIRARRSVTRASTGLVASLYSTYWASPYAAQVSSSTAATTGAASTAILCRRRSGSSRLRTCACHSRSTMRNPVKQPSSDSRTPEQCLRPPPPPPLPAIAGGRSTARGAKNAERKRGKRKP